jgi:GlpG protein
MNKSSWTLVAQVPVSVNLAVFSRQLNERRIDHEIIVSDPQQQIWVENPDHIVVVDQLLKSFIKPVESDPWLTQSRSTQSYNSSSVNLFGKLKTLFNSFPVVISGIILSVIGWLIVVLDSYFQWGIKYYLFFSSPAYVVANFEYWRLITPIFLHFSEMHLIFNALWLWVLGTRIEARVGSAGLLAVIMITGLFSNFSQFIWHSSTPFGGMSGVVYGLLGYLWMRAKFDPDPRLFLPPALMGMMVFFLVLAMTGALNMFAGGGIANAAHLGGLLSGLALGLFAGLKFNTTQSS